ncbi:hypothetical protein JB92DRAFT_1747488 [Gautieria morchelliformis]|nr:hypothetical protein JB92DRAFT_1747488 [Gautieria morchelliformis]
MVDHQRHPVQRRSMIGAAARRRKPGALRTQPHSGPTDAQVRPVMRTALIIVVVSSRSVAHSRRAGGVMGGRDFRHAIWDVLPRVMRSRRLSPGAGTSGAGLGNSQWRINSETSLPIHPKGSAYPGSYIEANADDDRLSERSSKQSDIDTTLRAFALFVYWSYCDKLRPPYVLENRPVSCMYWKRAVIALGLASSTLTACSSPQLMF